MEENKVKTDKIALNYGLLLGAVSCVFALMLYSMDMHYQGGMAIFGVSILLMISAIIIGLLQFKKANNGFMTFGQGLKTGVGICLVAGVIGVIFNLILTNVIDPDTMAKGMEYQKSELIANTKMTTEQIDAQLEMGKKFTTPLLQVAFGLIGSIVLGFLLTLIPALVMKKEESNFSS